MRISNRVLLGAFILLAHVLGAATEAASPVAAIGVVAGGETQGQSLFKKISSSFLGVLNDNAIGSAKNRKERLATTLSSVQASISVHLEGFPEGLAASGSDDRVAWDNLFQFCQSLQACLSRSDLSEEDLLYVVFSRLWREVKGAEVFQLTPEAVANRLQQLSGCEPKGFACRVLTKLMEAGYFAEEENRRKVLGLCNNEPLSYALSSALRERLVRSSGDDILLLADICRYVDFYDGASALTVIIELKESGASVSLASPSPLKEKTTDEFVEMLSSQKSPVQALESRLATGANSTSHFKDSAFAASEMAPIPFPPLSPLQPSIQPNGSTSLEEGLDGTLQLSGTPARLTPTVESRFIALPVAQERKKDIVVSKFGLLLLATGAGRMVYRALLGSIKRDTVSCVHALSSTRRRLALTSTQRRMVVFNLLAVCSVIAGGTLIGIQALAA